MAVKVFEELLNNRIVDHIDKCGLLISSMVLGLLNQLIFLQLYLIELLVHFTGWGLLEWWYLIYARFLTGCGIVVFITDLNIMEFQVRYLALFLLFLVIDGFKCLWMGSLDN